VDAIDHEDGAAALGRKPRGDRQRTDLVVFAYDIASDRRRARVVRWLMGFGDRVQRSVFECELTPARLEQAWDGARRLLGRDDRLSVYVLCAACRPRARRVPSQGPTVRPPVSFA
jgi:CRISPR-associated protein Cas2